MDAGWGVSSCTARWAIPSLGDWKVEEKILGRLPTTVKLGVMAIVIGLLIGLPVGIYSAMRRNTAADYVGRSVAIIGLATPNFWLATLILTFPAIWWAWSPPLTLVPFRDDPLGQSRRVHRPRPDSGHLPGGGHHADDAHHDAGGAPAGLRQDRLVQGAQGAGRDRQTRHQERPDPGSDPDRPARCRS